jgi:hypothetical protein
MDNKFTQEKENIEHDHIEEEEIRAPDKPFIDRLDGYNDTPRLTIDDELNILRNLNKADGKKRKNMKKFLKDSKIMDNIEKNVVYDNETIEDNNVNMNDNYVEENNMFPTDDDLERILQLSEEEYYNEQYLILEEMEREEQVKVIERKDKIIENKHNELDNIVKKITKIVKLSDKNTDDNVILDILNKYIDNIDDEIFLDEIEFNIFSNYLKKNYEDLYLLKKKTFLKEQEYYFLKNRIICA